MAPDSTRVGRRRPLVHRGVVLHCTGRFEEEGRSQGYEAVAGLDEVGRGALCGPVVAGAVILGDTLKVQGIDDSKRLTRLQREGLAERIREEARAFSVGFAEPGEIDRINILEATRLAMKRALAGLSIQPDLLLIDALTLRGVSIPQRAVVKGDALSVSIAAASILAKVARDAMMLEWDRQFPGYGLARNMGYGSQDHRDALRRLGPSRIHRRSFQGTERWLF